MITEHVLGKRGVDVREPAPAELLRPRHPDPAGLTQRAGHFARVTVGEHPLPSPFGIGLQTRTQRGREGSGLLAQRDLRVCHPEIHAAAIVEAS